MSVLIGKLPNLSIKFMLSAYLLSVFHHYYLVLLVRKKASLEHPPEQQML